MKQRRFDLIAISMLVVLILAALHMMSGAVQRSEELDQWFLPLLIFTVSGLVILVLLVGWSVWQLLQDYRRQIAGSRLNLRLVVMFVVLSMAPVSVVYLYSLQFLSKGIDSWFDVQVDNAMEDALSLSKVALDLHKLELLAKSVSLLTVLEDSSHTAIAFSVTDMREKSGAIEISMFDLQGKTLALSHQNPDVLTPSPPSNGMFRQVKEGNDFVSFIPTKDEQLVVRCLILDPLNRNLMLQAIYPVPSTLSILTGSVQDAYEVYKERAYLRGSIKFSFGLTLSLVLLLGLFGAAWGAFYTSRRLVQPIKDLSEGTRAVAEGNYDKRLPLPKNRDELGFLVDSFNEMTRRIEQSRNVTDASRRELQKQHQYLGTVLGALSSGVIVLDGKGLIETANPAAESILQCAVTEEKGLALQVIAEKNPTLKPFVERISVGVQGDFLEGRSEITLYRDDGRQVLLCRHSLLQLVESAGHVLVFDDVTELVRAQRDAAWGEVARRLAHEIKNPLTPIQLSAERLRHKYLHTMAPEDGDVLDRATKTIVQQVEAMKVMVNDFSDYARPCKMEPKLLDADVFLADVMALYEGSEVTFNANASNVFIEADPTRLRQVIHNLVKNGQEALSGNQGQVFVETQLHEKMGREQLEIIVRDTGQGFDAEQIDQVFEPYVTSKRKGTGLGLAIVKRIIGEHGGTIRAENAEQGGARIVMRLPLRQLSNAEIAIAKGNNK